MAEYGKPAEPTPNAGAQRRAFRDPDALKDEAAARHVTWRQKIFPGVARITDIGRHRARVPRELMRWQGEFSFS
jgi:hypothetical protein